jgi:hypothetical protein
MYHNSPPYVSVYDLCIYGTIKLYGIEKPERSTNEVYTAFRDIRKKINI